MKSAVTLARDFARELYGSEETPHMRLEEIQLLDDGRTWLVTLGWAETALANNPLIPTFSTDGPTVLPRVYKLFEVDAAEGKVRAMKIRDAA